MRADTFETLQIHMTVPPEKVRNLVKTLRDLGYVDITTTMVDGGFRVEWSGRGRAPREITAPSLAELRGFTDPSLDIKRKRS